MGYIKKEFIGLFIATLLLTACNQGAPVQSNTNKGITEYTAILANLEAIRKDVHGLHNDISELRKEVNGVKVSLAAAPAIPIPDQVQPSAAVVQNIRELLLDNDDPVIGKAEATLAMVEFSDYECPFCSRFNAQALPQIMQNYVDTGKMKLISRDLPLDFHPMAQSAAIAANCAAIQGAYEPVRLGLYSNQQSLGPTLYKKLASDNGLDLVAFEKCTQNPDITEEIRKDATYANSLGVTGTPSFFIGRLQGNKLVDVKSLVGALPYQSFSSVIDGML